jgi:hypothetical protein
MCKNAETQKLILPPLPPPSLPTGSPAATEQMRPVDLQKRVLRRVTRATLAPLRTHFISGMPDPPATGWGVRGGKEGGGGGSGVRGRRAARDFCCRGVERI